MSVNSSDGELNDLLSRAQTVAAETQRDFAHLSAQQINWQPGANEWSIGQCFEHLIKTNEELFQSFDEAVKDGRRSTIWESLPLLPAFWGREIIKRTRPEYAPKAKAPKLFKPASSGIDSRIIEKFMAHQGLLIEKLKASGGMNLEQIKVTSPIARFVTYSLLDAYKIMVFHEQRHFMQAVRVMLTEGFPQAQAENFAEV